MAGYYGGERNVLGAVGNIGGTANSFLAGNRRLLQSTPNNQQLLEEMKRRGITPSGGPQLPLAGSPFGSSNLAGATAQMNPGQPGNFAGFTDQLQADGMEQILAQLRENQSSLPNGFINKYVS
jgi:ABC-type transporter Mla subunit MlaD